MPFSEVSRVMVLETISPFVEAQYQQILKEKGEEAAKAFLTGYTSDFIGATILRWDEMTREFWIQSRFGL